MKRIIQILLILSVLCLGILPVIANAPVKTEEFIIEPCWKEVFQFNHWFDITSSGRADIQSELVAYDVDLIEVEVELQQFKNGSWVTIKTWKGSDSAPICVVVGKWYVPKKYGYRMVSTGRVYIGGKMVEEVNYTSRSLWYE